MRKGGDSYFVLVNKEDEVYTVDDVCEGEIILDFASPEAAEEELQSLIDEEELDPADGWHVERHRW